jgi:hypothetical protein
MEALVQTLSADAAEDERALNRRSPKHFRPEHEWIAGRAAIRIAKRHRKRSG